jgi:hypothetical protein
MSEDSRYALAHPEPEERPVSTAAATKYNELKAKIADARKQMEETAKGLFTEMAADLFAENPDLVSFGWTQYTPYFNDGDPCVFRCNGSYPTVTIVVDGDVIGYDSNQGELVRNGKEIKSAEDLKRTFDSLGPAVDSFVSNGKTIAIDRATNTITEDGIRVKTYSQIHDMFRPFEKKVATFLKTFEDEDMETMFGDHMRITVTRDGKVETEEYSHD